MDQTAVIDDLRRQLAHEKSANAALRESAQRLVRVLETDAVAVLFFRRDGVLIDANDVFLRMTGYTREDIDSGQLTWQRMTPPEFHDASHLQMARLLTEGRIGPYEKEYLSKDGSRGWMLFAGRDVGDGTIVELGVSIDDRKRAETELRASEERFRQFADASSDALWIRNADTLAMEYVSPAMRTIYGIEPETLLGDVKIWAALVIPDDRDVALGHIAKARSGEALVHEFRIQRPSDGTFRWIRDTDFPLRDALGNVQRIAGIAQDVTKSKLATEHQGILLAELQHRVRNIMAMLRSVTARTAITAASVADYESLMTGRLMALARTQSLLTRAVNVGVDIGSLVRDELNAHAHNAGQYEIAGPTLEISPKAAEVLSLAVHELASNSLKYGALSARGGKIQVTWQVIRNHGTPRCRLDWIERGPGSPAWTPPERKGFGSELIEQRVPYELHGRGELAIGPEGVVASIEFPLLPGTSILQTGAPVATRVFGGSIDMTGEPSLSGQTVLVLEDDYYLAEDTASALRSAGAEVVGPCSTDAEAEEAIRGHAITAAVLDINLGSGPSFATARALRAAGTPFVFLTGYDAAAIPAEFSDVIRLLKPVELRLIVRGIAQLH